MENNEAKKESDCECESHGTLLEDIKDKELVIETLKIDNEILRKEFATKSQCEDLESIADLYDGKIKEYVSALKERDDVIRQLEGKLEDNMYQKDELTREVENQSDRFNKEVELLEQQLKESGALLTKQNKCGINMADYLELQGKLIQIQQTRVEDSNKLEDTKRHMKLKSEEFGHLDQKYKLLVQTHNAAKEKHHKEISEYTDRIQILNNQISRAEAEHDRHLSELEEKCHADAEQEIKNAKNVFSSQTEQLQLQLNDVTKAYEQLEREAKESSDRSVTEVKKLMLQLDEANEMFSVASKEKEIEQKEWEEKKEREIMEIRIQHEKTNAEIRESHQAELALITEQMDIFEKNYTDQAKTMEALSSMQSVGDDLRRSLDMEREKCGNLMTKIATSEGQIRNLEEGLHSLQLSKASELKEQKELVITYKETIAKLEDQLCKLNEIKDSRIISLEMELQTEKEMKDLLNLKLQNADSSHAALNRELQSVHDVNCSLENDLQEAKTNLTTLSHQVETLHSEISSNLSLKNEVRELRLRVNEYENHLSSNTKYKAECHKLNNSIRNLTEILRARVCPDEAGHSSQTEHVTDASDIQRLESLVTSFITTHAKSEVVGKAADNSQEQDVYDLEKVDHCSQKQSDPSVFCCEDTGASTESSVIECTSCCESSGNDNIGTSTATPEGTGGQATLKKICVSCQAAPNTREHGFQTSAIVASSSQIASQTIEEDYMVEEIFVLPKTLTIDENVFKQFSSCIKSSYADSEDFRGKLLNSMYLITTLKNENKRLKRALLFKSSEYKDKGVDAEKLALNIGSQSEDTSYNRAGEKAESEQTNVNNYCFESQVKVLEEKYLNQAQIQTLDTMKQDIPSVAAATSSPVASADQVLRLRLLNIMEEKLNLLQCLGSSQETVKRLKMENLRLKELASAETEENPSPQQQQQEENQRTISLELETEHWEQTAPEPISLKIRHMQSELEIHLLWNEFLKEELQEKEHQLKARDGDPHVKAQNDIATGLMTLLSRAFHICDVKRRLTEEIAADWARVIESSSSPVHLGEVGHEAVSYAMSGRSVDSLLHGIQVQLKSLFEEQRENKKIMKEISNNLTSALEANLSSLKGVDSCSCVSPNRVLDKWLPVLDFTSSGAGSSVRAFGSMRTSSDREQETGNGQDSKKGEERRNSEGSDESVDGGQCKESAESEGRGAVAVSESERKRSAIEAGHDQLLREFDEVTLSVVTQAQEEKIEILENQKDILLNILKENQNKIAEICQHHMDKLKDTSSDQELDQVVDGMVENIKASLMEEVLWMETQYRDLLQQYSYEQSLNSQTHSLTLMELKERITSFLQKSACQECQQRKSSHEFGIFSRDLSSTQLHDRVAALSSFTDLEAQKRILNIMTQIILNLLHYYSVAQHCAIKSPFSINDNPLSRVITTCPLSKPTTLTPVDLDASLDELFGQNALDYTVVSVDGMLEDVEKDEQIKQVLSSACPNLISTLKGQLDDVSISELEKEVQELIISLQASTGMLSVRMLTQNNGTSDSSNESCETKSGLAQDLSHHPISQQSFSGDEVDLPDTTDYTICEYKEDGESSASHLTVEEPVVPMPNDESESLNEICSSDASINHTTLKPAEVPFDVQIKKLQENMRKMIVERDSLHKQLHQTRGLLAGLTDEKKLLEQKMCHLETHVVNLCGELQKTKEALETTGRKNAEFHESATTTPIKKQSPRDIKEKVRAALATKDNERLEQKELVARVRELEIILEEVVREREELTETFNVRIADLSQQLEVADRQLKQSRQFLDEQATERDQEFEVLIKSNGNLTSQLKEKETLASQNEHLQKEVTVLEKELRSKIAKLEAAKEDRDQRDADLTVALEKVRDLRDIVHSLESQLGSKCVENEKLAEQLQAVTADLQEETKECSDLRLQLEFIQRDRGFMQHNQRRTLSDDTGVSSSSVQTETNKTLASRSLSDELGTGSDVQPFSAMKENALLQHFIDMLQRSMQGLESLQVANTSASSVSDEELSVRDQLELTRDASVHESRVLSPSSLERYLEEKFDSFERMMEAAVKYTKDLEMSLRAVRTEYDEAAAERDELQQQLAGLSNLKSELEKASAEYDALHRNFEMNVTKLKDELSEIQKKLKETQIGKTEFGLMNKELRQTVSSLEAFKFQAEAEKADLMKRITALESGAKRAEILSREKADLERKLVEVCNERDCLHQQNSEQLIKLSNTEARLEEVRRAESPQDFELKMKITSLQDDLERNKTELIQKYRENKELQYTVKELRERLVLREEELDKMNQDSSGQPSSLPQAVVDQRLSQIYELKKEVVMLNEVIERLKFQIEEKEMAIKSSLDLSDALSSNLIKEKNLQISHLKSELQSLKKVAELFGQLREKGFSYEQIFTSVKSRLEDLSWQSHIRSTPEVMEIQRKDVGKYESHQTLWDGAELLKAGENYEILSESSYTSSSHPSNSSKLGLEPARLHLESGPRSVAISQLEEIPQPDGCSHLVYKSPKESEMNVGTNVSVDDILDERSIPKADSLESCGDDSSLLKAQVAILEQEIKGLTEYQQKLEDDFRQVQEMLEKKEEEIETLTEEIEDAAPSPLQTAEIHAYQEKLNSLLLRNEELECDVAQYREEIDSQRSEIVSLRDTIEVMKSKGALTDISSDSVGLEQEVGDLKSVEASVSQKLYAMQMREQELVREVKSLTDEHDRQQNQISNLQKEVELLERELTEKETLFTQQKLTLQKKDTEVEELSTHVDHLISQLKDASTSHERRLNKIQEEHSSLLRELQEKNVEREKQLCNEYEERMASQVTDLSLKLHRDKEECCRQAKEHYDHLLAKVCQEKEETLAVLQTLARKHVVYDADEAGEDLQSKVRLELSRSAQLDNSLVSFLEGVSRSEKGNASRESSVASEVGGTEDVAFKVQKLMQKVYKEGTQVLTLTELLFLQNHHSLLTPSLQSLICSEESHDSLFASQNRSQDSQVAADELQVDGSHSDAQAEDSVVLLSRISYFQQELSKREKDMRRKEGEQEKYDSEDWQVRCDKEMQEADFLRRQLDEERAKTFDLTYQVMQLKGELQLAQKELGHAHNEEATLRLELDSSMKQIRDLEEWLRLERKNFTRVSSTLTHQRKMSAANEEYQQQLIQELRDCVERERQRVVTLLRQHQEAQNRVQAISFHDSSVPNLFEEDSATIIDKELEIGLLQDKEKVLQMKVEEFEQNVNTLKEQLCIEKASYLSHVGEEQLKLSQLQKMMTQCENQKDKLMKELHVKDKALQLLRDELSELQKDYSLLKSELNIVASMHQRDIQRAPENTSEHRAVYADFLKKLNTMEFEQINLRKLLSKTEAELKEAKEREAQLLIDLETEKGTASLQEFPVTDRIKRLSLLLEKQQKENIELCKALSQQNDDRCCLRKKISTLETLVEELTEQKTASESSLEENVNQRSVFEAERTAYAAEKSTLQLALKQVEAKNMSLNHAIEELGKKLDWYQRLPNSDSVTDAPGQYSTFSHPREAARLRYLFWKYSRSESYRKALIWQKNYLITLLEGYQKTEAHTLGRLVSIAANVRDSQIPQFTARVHISPLRKFRSGVLVIISIMRMKSLVKRWQSNKQIEIVTKTTISGAVPSRSRLKSPALNPAPSSSPACIDGSIEGEATNLSERELRMNLQPTLNARQSQSNSHQERNPHNGASALYGDQITGRTPPTKDNGHSSATKEKSPSGSRRTLFAMNEASQFDDYIDRINSIHAHLGLPSTSSNP